MFHFYVWLDFQMFTKLSFSTVLAIYIAGKFRNIPRAAVSLTAKTFFSRINTQYIFILDCIYFLFFFGHTAHFLSVDVDEVCVCAVCLAECVLRMSSCQSSTGLN